MSTKFFNAFQAFPSFWIFAEICEFNRFSPNTLFDYLLRKNSTIQYSKLPAEAWFANILGMLILVFGLLVLLGLAIPGWKRPDVNSDIREVRNYATMNYRK